MIKLNHEYSLSDQLKLLFFVWRSADKPSVLLYLLREIIGEDETTIIFAATKYHVEFLQELFKTAGIEASYVYGTMDHEQRELAVSQFRKKRCKILIVTDVVARGIDIPLLNNVIHYDFPPSMKLFVHRSGRTARAGQSGKSFTLITNYELPYLIETGIYVGRKYVWNIQDMSEEEQKEAIENPLITLYGKVPQTILDHYNSEVSIAYERNWMLENIEKTVKNAMIKYKKFKNSASKESVSKAKEIGEVGIHPLIIPKVNIEEKVLINLQNEIKTFRPKLNAIECMYTRNKESEELEKLQKTIKLQK